MAPQPSSRRHQTDDAQQKLKPISSTEWTDRRRNLADLLPLWTAELNDTSYAGRLKVLVKLRRALRIERQNGTNGHWTYDLARHKALLDAYRCEVNYIRDQKNSDAKRTAYQPTHNK